MAATCIALLSVAQHAQNALTETQSFKARAWVCRPWSCWSWLLLSDGFYDIRSRISRLWDGMNRAYYCDTGPYKREPQNSLCFSRLETSRILQFLCRSFESAGSQPDVGAAFAPTCREHVYRHKQTNVIMHRLKKSLRAQPLPFQHI